MDTEKQRDELLAALNALLPICEVELATCEEYASVVAAARAVVDACEVDVDDKGAAPTPGAGSGEVPPARSTPGAVPPSPEPPEPPGTPGTPGTAALPPARRAARAARAIAATRESQ